MFVECLALLLSIMFNDCMTSLLCNQGKDGKQAENMIYMVQCQHHTEKSVMFVECLALLLSRARMGSRRRT